MLNYYHERKHFKEMVPKIQVDDFQRKEIELKVLGKI